MYSFDQSPPNGWRLRSTLSGYAPSGVLVGGRRQRGFAGASFKPKNGLQTRTLSLRGAVPPPQLHWHQVQVWLWCSARGRAGSGARCQGAHCVGRLLLAILIRPIFSEPLLESDRELLESHRSI